jgi:RTX calcium-binding nonapeptide repeat (4 copies)
MPVTGVSSDQEVNHSERKAMKNLSPHTSSRRPRPKGLTALAVAAAAAVAGGVLAGAGNAAPAGAAGTVPSLQKKSEQFKAPTLENGLLTVEGTNAADRIALRLQAGQPGIVEVDFGDDGSAEFSFERSEIARIVVEAGNGADAVRIDEINGVFANTIPTTIDGGNGADRLVGGAGAGTLNGGNGDDDLFGGNGNETLLGGNGKDSIDGNRGNDAAFLGNGADTFVWDPGDGSDTIEGQNGTDTLLFNGANIAEQVDLSANGNRLRFFRDIANITMDTDGVERVDFNALGGDDVVTVNDLSGTDVSEVNVDLAGSLGGATGDGAADSVIVNGTDGDDRIKVNGDAGGVKVSGLVPTVNVLHSEFSNDRLEIETLAGTDTVKSAGQAAGAIQLFVDGVLVSDKNKEPK